MQVLGQLGHIKCQIYWVWRHQRQTYSNITTMHKGMLVSMFLIIPNMIKSRIRLKTRRLMCMSLFPWMFIKWWCFVRIRQDSILTTGWRPSWLWLCLESGSDWPLSTNSPPGTEHIWDLNKDIYCCFNPDAGKLLNQSFLSYTCNENLRYYEASLFCIYH